MYRNDARYSVDKLQTWAQELLTGARKEEFALMGIGREVLEGCVRETAEELKGAAPVSLERVRTPELEAADALSSER
jgi:hypothetical protein